MTNCLLSDPNDSRGHSTNWEKLKTNTALTWYSSGTSLAPLTGTAASNAAPISRHRLFLHSDAAVMMGKAPGRNQDFIGSRVLCVSLGCNVRNWRSVNDVSLEGSRVHSLTQLRTRCAVLVFESRHQFRNARNVFDQGAALPASPDVAPRLDAIAAEIHPALVRFGQFVGIKPRFDDARAEVVTMDTSEQVRIYDIV